MGCDVCPCLPGIRQLWLRRIFLDLVVAHCMLIGCVFCLSACICRRSHSPRPTAKIKRGEHRVLPPHVSPGARQLLKRLFTVDPARRITLEEIKQDPWFRVGYAAPPVSLPTRALDTASVPLTQRLATTLRLYGDATVCLVGFCGMSFGWGFDSWMEAVVAWKYCLTCIDLIPSPFSLARWLFLVCSWWFNRLPMCCGACVRA